MTYTEALQIKASLEAQVDLASKALQAFPRLPNGLTTDEAKRSPEWRAARSAYDLAVSRVKKFNGAFFKLYAKEEKARRRAMHAARVAAFHAISTPVAS